MTRTSPGRPRGRASGAPRRSTIRTLADYAATAALFALLVVLALRLDALQTIRQAGHPFVGDGDSITLDGKRIRLRGIDAPEYEQVCSRNGTGYACGKQSRQALAALVGARTVTCSGSRHDRYGRLLAECKAGEVDLNRAQVEAGWAVSYGDFAAEEAQAKAARRGIWAGPFEAPQDWRRDHGRPPEASHDTLGGLGDWLRGLLRA